jgi:hypothetical protein
MRVAPACLLRGLASGVSFHYLDVLQENAMRSVMWMVVMIGLWSMAATADAGPFRRNIGTVRSYSTTTTYPSAPTYSTMPYAPYSGAMPASSLARGGYGVSQPVGIYATRANYGYGYYQPYGSWYGPSYYSYNYGMPVMYSPGYLPPRYYGGVGYWGGVGGGYYYGAGSRMNYR